MTPEDMDQLRQLKNLVDSGVLSSEDFEFQKNLILSSTGNNVVSSRRRLDEMLPGSDVPRLAKSTGETVIAAQRAAVRVQIIAFLFAGSGILFGIVLMAYGNSDDVESAGPYVGAGVVVALNAVVLAIILYAIGKFMEARLMQGSDLQGKSQ
jgi:hypothetical protein